MSILCHILCFFFEVRPAARQLSDPGAGDVYNRHCGYPFIKQRLMKTGRQTSASADLFVLTVKDVCTGLLVGMTPPAASERDL